VPAAVAELLQRLDCPPRLAAHLRAVHDVACQLADWAGQRRPPLAFDRDAVLFGAATHDIGKTVHPGELSGPGSAHEEAGRQLLLDCGISPELARPATGLPGVVPRLGAGAAVPGAIMSVPRPAVRAGARPAS
jgi:hypothetical protein